MKIIKILLVVLIAAVTFASASAQVRVKTRVVNRHHRTVVVRRPAHHRKVVVRRPHRVYHRKVVVVRH